MVHGLEPSDNDPNTLGVTICVYFTSSGVNVECDMQIDNDNVSWSATDPPAAGRMVAGDHHLNPGIGIDAYDHLVA